MYQQRIDMSDEWNTEKGFMEQTIETQLDSISDSKTK